MKKLKIITLLFFGLTLLGQNKPKLVYIADPLCSWCYGFQPEMDKILAAYGQTCDLEIVAGGMGIGNKKPLDQEFKESLQDHWKQIKELTGQEFDHEILNTKGLIYNSEPLCRAIVTAKDIDSTKGLAMHKMLQKYFYAKNKNVTLLENIKLCALELKLDTATFIKTYNSEKIKKATQADFDRVERNGIEGFPALILVKNDKPIIIAEGYTKFKKIDKKLKKLLKK
jgi:putative protein-disulfide isomerase